MERRGWVGSKERKLVAMGGRGEAVRGMLMRDEWKIVGGGEEGEMYREKRRVFRFSFLGDGSLRIFRIFWWFYYLENVYITWRFGFETRMNLYEICIEILILSGEGEYIEGGWFIKYFDWLSFSSDDSFSLSLFFIIRIWNIVDYWNRSIRIIGWFEF